MLTIDLEPELEIALYNMAQQEHISPDEIIKRFIRQKQADNRKQIQAKQELLSLMSKVPASVSLASELMQERRLDAAIEQQDTQ